MSEVCEALINDFLSGELSKSELELSLTSIFTSKAQNSTVSQTYLHKLFTDAKIDSDTFKQLSEVISRVHIEATLNKSSKNTEISYFNENNTIHLTDHEQQQSQPQPQPQHQPLAATELDLSISESDTEDKTVIVSASSSSSLPEGLKPEEEDDSDPGRPRVVARPHRVKHANLTSGVTLKDRFVLMEKLGQGGMGIVFKAKDLLKIEAHDKNPFVAIKVLTDAFKKYSGSFIALQREASKAQKLAHPNIATVYDFDRDGDTVFMTMEYLEGKPLNKIMKEISKTPLKTKDALYIIEELSNGLAYAHEKHLIHSDFKPGNCFVLTDGSVKLLDFGIARASTQTAEERENTLFDPSKLSAVTPAYATPEMFAGMNPDPRDDIYGLACVAYQLLAGGKHPYNKVAAPKIKELGIKPKPIKGLNRRQQKTLLKALSVDRDERIETVNKFLTGMRLKKSHAKAIILVALFITIIAAGIGYKPFLAFQQEQELYDKISTIKKGNRALLIETIWSLEKMQPEHQKIISVGLRREIITFYRDRVNSVFRPDDGLYDYPEAQRLLLQAKAHYPDSVALSTIENNMNSKQSKLLASLSSLYNKYFKAKRLIKTKKGQDMTTIIPIIKRVDPGNPLLTDNKLATLYLSQAEHHLANRRFSQAAKYILTGLKLFPDHPRLVSLNKQINAPIAQ